MSNLPKLNQLQVFRTIIQHGSIRAAAKALNQTQPSMTRTMKELEKTLGTSLMVRGTRGVMLTEAGKLFEPRIQWVLKELERAVKEAGHFSKNFAGTVALGCSSLPAFTVLPAAIQRFQKRFPQVNIQLSEEQLPELLTSLRTGELDFAIGEMSIDTVLQEFIQEPFFMAPACILARREHPLAKSTSLTALKEAKWYLPRSKMGYYHELDAILFSNRRDNIPTIVRGNTTMMAIQMMLSADFLTVASQEMLKVPYLNKHICCIPIKEPLPQVCYSFIYSQHLPLTGMARSLMNQFFLSR